MSAIEILIILSMLVLNGVFAAYELALASLKATQLRAAVEQGRRGARAALHMKERMEGSLAVVQLGLTLAGAIAAATGGAHAQESIAPWLIDRLGLSGRAAHVLALAVLVVPLSASTIVIGELIPKVFAIRNAELVCLRLSPLIHSFARLAFPFVAALELITRGAIRCIDRLRGGRTADDPQASLNELKAHVDLLRATNVIGSQEQQIILGASRLSRTTLRQIMLPASDIVMLMRDQPLIDAIAAAHLDLHTRFPVATRRDDPQSIVGYVNFKELVLLAKTHPHKPDIAEIVRPLGAFAEQLPVSEALRQLVADHHHLALVQDRRGTVVGLITLEDVFEELVGDIEDEFDRLPKHVSGSGPAWVMGGGVPLARVRQVLGDASLAAAARADTLLGDWLRAQHASPPHGGDVVVHGRARFTVRKVRRQRIVEVLVDVEQQTSASIAPH